MNGIHQSRLLTISSGILLPDTAVAVDTHKGDSDLVRVDLIMGLEVRYLTEIGDQGLEDVVGGLARQGSKRAGSGTRVLIAGRLLPGILGHQDATIANLLLLWARM